MAAYPRIYVSQLTHDRVQKAAKKRGVTMKQLGDKVVKEGLKVINAKN